MRGFKNIASSLILGVTLSGAAIAAPATAPARTAPASATATLPASTDADCEKVGGDVSALIDTGTGSPNISAARAVFQRGIMECMEGDDSAANKHYQEAKKLLSSDQRKTPAAPAKSAATRPPVANDNADCQKVGGEVSALIDTGTGSPSISAARAVFQRGIMECMEGDDNAANTHYQEAKKLLSSDERKAQVSSPRP